MLLIVIQNSFVAGGLGDVRDVAQKFVERVLGTRNDDCANNNNYKHDPTLSSVRMKIFKQERKV